MAAVLVKRSIVLRKKSWVEEVIFETVLLACMVKPKFGLFSRVGGNDWVIDNVNLR